MRAGPVSKAPASRYDHQIVIRIESMNKLFAAAALSLALVAPVAAQGLPTFTEEQIATATAAIAELDLDETLYQELWCGAAYVAFAQYLQSQGNADGAAAATQQSNILFQRVETKLAPMNYTQEQLEGIGHDASVVAITQLTAGNEEFTQEACTAAVAAE